MIQLNPDEIKKVAVNTLLNEAEAINDLIPRIDDRFVEAVEVLIRTKGRVIVTGIGKSADIGRKIVATFNSTGTPAIFLHAADAIHGDLGTVTADDVILCLSKSGDTPEIKILVPLLKTYGNKLICIVGNIDSFLGRHSDIVLDASVGREACPNNLAPTSSTTAQLAMGDALAVALLHCRGFSPEDFARYHPGGALGKQLYLKVADLYPHNEKPMVDIDEPIASVIIEISSKRLGTAAVIHNGILAGIVTDGDLRRMLQNHTSLYNLTAGDIMSVNPRTIQPESMVVDALQLMRQNNITQLLVVDHGEYLGVIHLHDILREGII
jgi:arabinose-5-phosphate isomerase